MANINIEIPDEIYKKAKLSAIMQEKTVKDFVIEKLTVAMRSEKFKGISAPEFEANSRRRK